MGHKHAWWAADHMAKTCQSYKQQKEVLQHGRQFSFAGRWIHSSQLSHICANRYPKLIQIHRAFHHCFFYLAQTVPQITVIVLFSVFFFCAEVSNAAFLKATEKDSMLLWRKSTFFEEQHESQNLYGSFHFNSFHHTPSTFQLNSKHNL